MDAEEQQHIKSLLKKHRERLRWLEQQAAQKGINTPPEVGIEIQDIQITINQLQSQLNGEVQNSHPLSNKPSNLLPKAPSTPNSSKTSIIIGSVAVFLFLIGAIADIFGAWTGVRQLFSDQRNSSNPSANVATDHPNIPTILALTTEISPIIDSTSPTTNNTITTLPSVVAATSEVEPTAAPFTRSASGLQLLQLDQPVEGVLTNKQVVSFSVAGAANTPILVDVKAKQGEGTGENFNYQVRIINNKKEVLAEKAICCAYPIRIPFTPPADGEYIVELTGQASFGTYTVVIRKP